MKAVARRNYRKLINVAVLLLLVAGMSRAQENYYAGWFNSNVRALSMGGASTSIIDDIPAALYNPAAFTLFRQPKSFRITPFLNPVLALSSYRNDSQDFTERVSTMQMCRSASLALKALFVSIHHLDAGVILNERMYARSFNGTDFFSVESNKAWEYGASTFVASLKIAHRAMIGANATYYYHPDVSNHRRRLGFSYGVLVQPSDRLNVGLSYIDLPEMASSFRSEFDRLADETMNIGISWYPTGSTTIALDVRNLTEEDVENVREVHIGLEQTIFSVIALRGGLYKERFTEHHHYSLGIGLMDSNLIFHRDNKLGHGQFMLNYGLIWQDDLRKTNRYHFLSLLFRL